MRTEVIRADTIEAAVERILDELKDTRRSREHAVYFDGWDGLGASAVLRAVAQRLPAKTTTRPTELEFEQIIHIDCSKWQSRRAVQRAIAEQLKLPSRVMDMFDKQDEEDDFDGVDQGSRAELAQVAWEINKTLQNHRFLVILHNGSNDEIDISKLGLSLNGYASNKMLWTFRGRFRLDPKMRDKVTSSTADAVLSASRHERDPQELWSYLVCEEATELVAHHCNHGGITVDDSAAATQVAECLWYMLERGYVSQHIIDYGWALHTSNYLVCDGIILTQQQQDKDGVHEAAWQLGDALHQDMELYIDYLSNKLPPRQQAEEEDDRDDLLHSHVRRPHWISTTTCGFVLSPAGVIPSSMFQHSDRLGMLKLSRCTFRFSSPPFLCCHSLRFLWLDRCQDQDLLQTRSTTDHYHHADADADGDADADADGDADADAENEDTTTNRSLWACFESLWVLDLRYTYWDRILSAQMMDLMTQLRELNIMGANWDMSHLRGRLRNIRKLRVTKSTCRYYSSSSFLSGMERMELLNFSGNHTTQDHFAITAAAAVSSSLKTVIIDGCVGLRKITLHNCAELKNLLLRGLFRNLEELDLSGTTLQTIDLNEMQIPDLKRLLLTGCEHLRAIMWPPEGKRPELDVLRIDTTSRSASADGRGDENLAAARLPSFNKWRISLTDARLLRSFLPVKGFFETGDPCHIDIHPAAATVGGSPHTSMVDSISMYEDVFKKAAHPANNIYDDGLVMWDCPDMMPLPTREQRSCLIEIMRGGQGSSKLLEGAQTSTSASTSSGVIPVPDFICDAATSLHVYDNSCITRIPAPPEGSRWTCLRWCRVERCPKLYSVFTTPQGSYVRIFYYLRTFWASQLPAARYVWNWPAMPQYEGSSFEDLEFLHLDYCPRLINVLPLSISTLPRLHTLEIVCCGDLTEVFPLRQEQQAIIEFPKLRRIHLHELPKLQRICGRTMSAPILQTVRIRGCWSLRRLPAVGDDDDDDDDDTKPKPPPTVDCEKEWWDNLEWDGVEAKHHPSLYRLSHSPYNKTQLPKGSLLR